MTSPEGFEFISWKQKSKVFEKFKKWKTIVEKQKEQNVKVLRSDNGGEYTSAEFKEYLTGEGIEHQLSISGATRTEWNSRVHEHATYRACPQYKVTG